MYGLSIAFLTLSLLCCGFVAAAGMLERPETRAYFVAAWTAALSLPASAVCYHFATGVIQ